MSSENFERPRDSRTLYGFHAVTGRVKVAPQSVQEVYLDSMRRDARMQQLRRRLTEAGVRTVEADAVRLTKLAGHVRHQGVVARVQPLAVQKSLDDFLDGLSVDPLLLLLDGVSDPHNLGACLRVADAAGVHAIIAPRDHAVGINATVAKVASGAGDTVPYFMVTNLARTMNELQERGIRCVGAAEEAQHDCYGSDLRGPLAIVLGAEDTGMRELTRKHCDALVAIPMLGAVESLNVAVASGILLYESLRQRQSRQ